MAKKRTSKSSSKSKGDDVTSSAKNTDYLRSINQPPQNAAYREVAVPPRLLRPPFTSGSRRDGVVQVPHRGSLCRIDSIRQYSSSIAYQYGIEIKLENGAVHDLRYEQQQYDFMSRLFAILDTESRGSVGRAAVMEFVTLRCPVFWRRDNDLRRLGASVAGLTDHTSPTFDEVWTAVAQCSNTTKITNERAVELGVEGWMVFCRFIALAQYLEAKRRFSARHLQQTMRHRNSPRGSEVVVVDVPPQEPPVPLSATQLAEYERKVRSPLPLPELDLDHSLVASRDVYVYHHPSSSRSSPGKVQISLFGSSSLIQSPLVPSSATTSFSSSNLEFAVTYTPSLGTTNEGSWGSMSMENTVVRRSFDDMKWLNDTFTAHKKLGGTLCGRILPPFPYSSHYQTEDALRTSSAAASGGAQMAMDAAVAGVDLLTTVAKSFWGSYVTPSSSESVAQPSNPITNTSGNTGKKSNPGSFAIPENYYNANSPVGKARQLERYLNYLLEHPALSTSFALNTILKASQSGLEAAKQSVRDHAKSLKQHQSQAPQLHGHPARSPTSVQPNLSWVRTAAQAAMALKVHGILETSGMPSASARLQHASLPSFDNASRGSAWADEEDRHSGRGPKHAQLVDASVSSGHGSFAPRATSETEVAESFERGVVQVESELRGAEGAADASTAGDDDGYDLLPDPVPAPERRILCAGSAAGDAGQISNEPSIRGGGSLNARGGRSSARFHYGLPSRRHQIAPGDADESQHLFLEDIAVDDDIDKLREVIGSVDNTLSRCLAASGGIGGARRQSHNLQLDIVRGFDSWEGLRGKFIAQRALLKGVSGLEQSKDVSEESDLELVDDISWQASLADSAVSAAEDVRSTVRAARTAANAKAAADAAALAAQKACDNGKFSSVDEARAAQTRSSIAQSHAIHAAVVEHEAKTAKRRAALALAHDVKCWNVHRKRELLRTCLRSARSQLEASRRAVDAWSCLRDGYVGSPVVPFADTRRVYASEAFYSGHGVSTAEADASATIFSDALQSSAGEKTENEPEIKAVDHNLLAKVERNDPDTSEQLTAPSNAFPEEEQEQPPLISFDDDAADPEVSVPASSGHDAPFDFSLASPATENSQAGTLEAPSRAQDETEGDEKFGMAEEEKTEDREKLSASMQSLVDGLMAWGGQYDSEEDVALPTGMAASIAFEETGLMGS